MLILAIFALSVVSGMLGIGVALAAVPVLSLSLDDLVNQVHPVSLLLNGVTALFAALSFGRAGLIEWPRATQLLFVATAATPTGAWLARSVPAAAIWTLYFAAVIFLLTRLLHPVVAPHEDPSRVRFSRVLWLAVPASVLSGLIGVGPGFLLVPLMLHYGIGIKQAAALNALAVTPASLLAAVPHLAHMSLPQNFLAPLLAAGAIGGLAGAWLASYRLSPTLLKWTFFVVVAATAAYRAWTLATGA
ncbi:MAG: sulfite exporter TauE/SafE family protein [Rhodocyclales bacterium]|nr:sulfite exporter TauE/SafE family protein [Rhodocyclales bacterium]